MHGNLNRQWLVDRLVALKAVGHRQLMVISGPSSFRWQGAAEIYAFFETKDILILTEGGIPQLGEAMPGADGAAYKRVKRWQPSAAKDLLGTEWPLVILDGTKGLEPDALGALSGTVRAGGLFILLLPALESWPQSIDPQKESLATYPHGAGEIDGHFRARLVRLFQENREILIWEAGKTPPWPHIGDEGSIHAEMGPKIPSTNPENPPSGPLKPLRAGESAACIIAEAKTQAQRRAIEGVLKVRRGRKKRPLVMISDRGRGKTTALALATALLLVEEPGIQIVITAPKPQSIHHLFEHIRRLLGGERRGYAYHYGPSRLSYQMPGALLAQEIPADLLLVDEAAALPLSLLKRYLADHKRVVFSTTVHGYEGTGRGFALRFQRYLQDHFPGWKALKLDEPIRWSPGDPLEAFVNQALLLNADPMEAARLKGVELGDCHLEAIAPGDLVADEALLSSLFGLLVAAHYRTSPADLLRLLDSPSRRLYLLRQGPHVLGAIWANLEGGLPPALDDAICRGERRPKGHFLPETLAFHEGRRGIIHLKALRIIRIAIHPAIQGRGWGLAALQALEAAAQVDGVDYLGTAFGATTPLVNFWSRAGYRPLRMGIKAGKSSGLYACVMAKGLSPAGQSLIAAQSQDFLADFPHQLADPLRDLDAPLADRLFRSLDGLKREDQDSIPLSDRDRALLQACASGERDPDLTAAALWRFTRWILMDPRKGAALSTEDRILLIQKVLAHRPWIELGQPKPMKRRLQALLRAAL